MKNRYADRRSKLGAMLPKNSAVVIAGAAVQYRNADSSHAFRQDSNFWYLTGFNEPESTLVLLINESKDVQSIAFVPKKETPFVRTSTWHLPRAPKLGTLVSSTFNPLTSKKKRQG